MRRGEECSGVDRHRAGDDPAPAQRAAVHLHRSGARPEPVVLLTTSVPALTVVPAGVDVRPCQGQRAAADFRQCSACLPADAAILHNAGKNCADSAAPDSINSGGPERRGHPLPVNRPLPRCCAHQHRDCRSRRPPPEPNPPVERLSNSISPSLASVGATISDQRGRFRTGRILKHGRPATGATDCRTVACNYGTTPFRTTVKHRASTCSPAHFSWQIKGEGVHDPP